MRRRDDGVTGPPCRRPVVAVGRPLCTVCSAFSARPVIKVEARYAGRRTPSSPRASTTVSTTARPASPSTSIRARRDQLRLLLDSADSVIEASRPRALLRSHLTRRDLRIAACAYLGQPHRPACAPRRRTGSPSLRRAVPPDVGVAARATARLCLRRCRCRPAPGCTRRWPPGGASTFGSLADFSFPCSRSYPRLRRFRRAARRADPSVTAARWKRRARRANPRYRRFRISWRPALPHC